MSSTKPPIAYIEIRVFAHATENPQKVQDAVKNLLTPPLTEGLLFQKTNLSGHHGNTITLFNVTLKDKKHLPDALKKIGAELGSLDKEVLEGDIKLHIERGNLYLRFDKQAAFLGSPKFTMVDPIHFKVHFKDFTPDEVVEFSRQAGLLP
jgi:RNA binding exosome subunit